MHAEVLVRRALKLWLIDILADAARLEPLFESSSGLLRLRQGIQLWLYSSAVPCPFSCAISSFG